MSGAVPSHPARGAPRARAGFAAAAVLALAALVGCAGDPGPGPGPPPGPFPNLTEAEYHLRTAISYLRRAPPIFGGHKAEAVRLIEVAVGELEAAKASAER